MSKPRPWAKEQPPRRATVLEIAILFAVALAGFAGAAAVVWAFSMRDLRFEPRGSGPGAAMVVEWRFFGWQVWQRRFPRIIDVEQKRITIRGDFDPSDPSPAAQVDVLVVFKDEQRHEAFTVRHTSHLNEVIRLHRYFTEPAANADGVNVRETARWWASDPVSDLCGGVVGLLFGLAIGGSFLVGAVSALHVRLFPKMTGHTSGSVFRGTGDSANLSP